MFNPTEHVIESFVKRVEDEYIRTYSNVEPSYPGIIGFVGRLSLEIIANSDAPYHDVNHTIMVTQAGLQILRGKHLRDGGVAPRDWLNFTVSLFCHDIGYIRGICKGDRNDICVINDKGDTLQLAPGATDAALTDHHVDRGQIFVRERFGKNLSVANGIIDVDVVCDNIEHTRFPIPTAEDYQHTDDFPGLLRAADLIGQMADINYMRKISALFSEFRETGKNIELGYETAADLRAGYPKFFWKMVEPYIEDALTYLSVTQEGKLWPAVLYSHMFAEEHGMPSMGAVRGGS
jgi:hypothetical protein